MSTTRSRARPSGNKTYTARLYKRATPKPTRRWPTRHVPALLAVVAEAGHLTAALAEWPTAPTRGLFHIVIAAGLGLLATTVYFGHTRLKSLLGTVFLLAIPTAWLTGALLGHTPYQDFPILAAIAVSVAELAAAGLLFGSRKP